MKEWIVVAGLTLAGAAFALANPVLFAGVAAAALTAWAMGGGDEDSDNGGGVDR